MAIVPMVLPLLLLFLPAMLAALAVVREKELRSIVNFYVTPVTRLEFIAGKQLPYIVVAVFNFLLLVLISIFFFKVPMKGSFLFLWGASFFYVAFSTAFGLMISSFTKSQMAAAISVQELYRSFIALVIAAVVTFATSVVLQKKQER